MPKPLAPTFATVYGSVAEEVKRRLGDAQAAQMGPPVGEDIEPAGDRERVEAWNARNPQATDAAMLSLAQQKYAEHTASGLPPEQAIRATAEDLTHFRYGQRLALYTYGQVGMKEQVKEAERIARLAKRDTHSSPDFVGPSGQAPDPEPATPTMMSAAATNAEIAPGPEAIPQGSAPGTAPGPSPGVMTNGTSPMVPSDTPPLY